MSENRFVPAESIDEDFVFNTVNGKKISVNKTVYNNNINKIWIAQDDDPPTGISCAYVQGHEYWGIMWGEATGSGSTESAYPIRKSVIKYTLNGTVKLRQVFLLLNPIVYTQYRVTTIHELNPMWSSIISNYYIFLYNNIKYGWRVVDLTTDRYNITDVFTADSDEQAEHLALSALLLCKEAPPGVPLQVPVQWNSTKYGKLYQDSCEIKVSQ